MKNDNNEKQDVNVNENKKCKEYTKELFSSLILFSHELHQQKITQLMCIYVCKFLYDSFCNSSCSPAKVIEQCKV